MTTTPLQRTALQLYRDCLRLVKHVAPGHSPKSLALRRTVRMEFDQHANETDPQRVEMQKAKAVRALANYMLFESASKDPKVKQAMDAYHTTSVDELLKTALHNNSKTKAPRVKRRNE